MKQKATVTNTRSVKGLQVIELGGGIKGTAYCSATTAKHAG